MIPAAERSGAGTGSAVVFLDRDGVVNRQVVGDYVRSVAQLEFLPGALEAIGLLTAWAAKIVVVTNQQGVGKGLMSADDLDDIHAWMRSEVARTGGRIDDVLACTHLQGDRCPCRKPGTQMPLTWLADHPDVALEDCFMVGDSASDIAMGRRLSPLVTCVLVGGRTLPADQPQPDLRVPTLLAFAQQVSAGARREALR